MIYEKAYDLQSENKPNRTQEPSSIQTPHTESTNRFSVAELEKTFALNVWGYADESIFNKVALSLKSAKETINFCHLAMLNAEMPDNTYKCMLRYFSVYQKGWDLQNRTIPLRV